MRQNLIKSRFTKILSYAHPLSLVRCERKIRAQHGHGAHALGTPFGAGSSLRVMPAAARIICKVIATRPALTAELTRIVRACAKDLGQKISVRTATSSAAAHRSAEPVLTLHLPAELAAAQHPVWCLACRLACFCPTARVSVLVHGETALRAEATPAPASASAATPRRRAA